MSEKVTLRALTSEELAAVEKLAKSRTAAARLVERAQMILGTTNGERPTALATRLHVARKAVYASIHRFNAEGMAGLNDLPRSGRPPTYSAQQISEVVAASLTDPQTLGLPFASWTLDRLAAYLNEHKGIAMKRSRINEILLAEGLRWRKQETWFGERLDPAFAEKRGPSSNSTPRRRRTVP